MKMRHTREMLAASPLARQSAVCRFPIMVADCAATMQSLIQRSLESQTLSDATREAIDHCEEQIKEAYRECFGRELGR
jgi:hypothetical protein